MTDQRKDEMPSFKEIQDYAWRKANRQHVPVTVFDAAKRFKIPAKTIVDIVRDIGSPYFYIVGDSPKAEELTFEFDGE